MKDFVDKFVFCVIKVEKYYIKMGYGSFVLGNVEGGLII